MHVYLRPYSCICLRHFMIFPCNIQSIAINITPAFKIQRQYSRCILKKQFPRAIVKILENCFP